MNDQSTTAVEPTEGTKSVTVLLPEPAFLLACFIQASNRYSRTKLVTSYLAQILADPHGNLRLEFTHQEDRSLTVSLPLDIYNTIYENAVREGICEGQLIKRLLVDKIPVKLQELAEAMIEELKLNGLLPANANLQDGTQIETEQNSAKVARSTAGDELDRFLADYDKSTPPVTEVDRAQAINHAFSAASYETGYQLSDANEHHENGV